jgi:hypothetical protein
MKYLLYVIIAGFLFSYLDWQVIHLTRLSRPEWKEWMHAHERQYAAITGTLEFVLCAPALALKPVFYNAILSSKASQEEQDAITHAPKPDWRGFYHLPVRGQSWTFVSWLSWFLYWTPISLIWWRIINGFIHPS